nr:MAG TPA: DNA-directed RNA polymerase alpha chain [Caudoviricetes sp.]
MRLSARKLLAIPPQELPHEITGDFTLVMDDGEIQTNAKETIISSYFWEYHRKYKKLPLKVKHHLHPHLKGKRLKNKTHLSLLSAIVDDWYQCYDTNKVSDIDHTEDKLKMLKIGYDATNLYYNNVSTLASRYVTSVDITDITDIINHPKVKSIRTNGNYSQKGIQEIHRQVLDTILNDPDLKDNNTASLLRSGLVKDSQLLQCIGPYGYPKDIDDYIFPEPIKKGFCEGFVDFYDSLTESRSASMALHFSKSHLSKVEYFSRKAQLIGMNFATIHRGDCGSKHYLPWEVRNIQDVRSMTGVYYLDDQTKKLVMIHGNETDLIGQVLKIRTIIGCIHPDPNGACATCFGGLSRNIIHGTNIGQQVGVTLASQNSQNVLSTKHVIQSAVASSLMISGNQIKFFTLTDDKQGYKLSPYLEKEELKLTIPSRSMLSITKIQNIVDLDKISIFRATDIRQVKMTYMDRTNKADPLLKTELVILEYQSRHAHGSRALLKYIRNGHLNIDSKGDYEIPLVDWNDEDPIFICPEKQFSTVNYSKGIEGILESRVKLKNQRDQTSPIDFIKELTDYIAIKMNLPLSVLIGIAYSAMIVSAKDGDYSMPKPWTDSGVGVMLETMTHRSLGPYMAFQTQDKVLTNPLSFTNTNRLDHLFDYMLLPREVMKYRIYDK